MLALDAAYAIEATLHLLEAIKKADPKVIQIETRMTRALRTRFRIIHQATAQALDDMGRIPHADVQVITAPLTTAIADLQKIVSTHAGTAAEMGRARIKTHLRKKKKLKKSGKSFAEKEAHPGANAGAGAAGSYSGPMETGPAWNKAKQKIIDKAISSTDDSWHRMTDDITNCLSDTYENKLTLDQTKAQLGTVMDNMEGYELERIARTIVNGAQNAASADTISELGLDYQQWWTAEDDRVRGMDPKDSADHMIMHGQIVAVGMPFSNGLMFPGDESGPIEEWILCRCQIVPFLMPEGLTAPPGEEYFYESDLVVLGSEATAPEEVQQPDAQVTEPKPEEEIIPLEDNQKAFHETFQGSEIENAQIFDENGKFIAESQGTEGSCKLPDVDLKNTDIIHNHPDATGTSVLSPEDIDVAMRNDVKSMSCVTDDGVKMTITRPEEGWKPTSLDDIKSAFEESMQKLKADGTMGDYAQKIRGGKMTPHKANQHMTTIAMKDAMDNLGVKYSYGKIR